MLFPKKHTIFTQGDPADAVFYLQTGKVRLTVSPRLARKQQLAY
jgi:CRP-like cAMP-binding protein